MGRILMACCPCGYSKEVIEGRGLKSSENLTPVLCLECLDVYSLIEDHIKCRNCGSRDIFRYSNGSLLNPKTTSRLLKYFRSFLYQTRAKNPEVIVGNQGSYLCPQCQKYSLRFQMDRLWD